MTEPESKCVLITGANRGLGLSLAVCFLRGGFRVLAGVRDPSSNRVASIPSAACIIPLDVTIPESINQAVHKTREITSALDILINNAGVHLEPQAATLEELDLADGHLERTLAVNAFGPSARPQSLPHPRLHTPSPTGSPGQSPLDTPDPVSGHAERAPKTARGLWRARRKD